MVVKRTCAHDEVAKVSIAKTARRQTHFRFIDMPSSKTVQQDVSSAPPRRARVKPE
jgi:hypothetical protein